MIKLMNGRILTLALAVAFLALSVRANIYVTNLRMLTNSVAGADVKITYILNEPAAQGVALNISSGSNLVRTLTVANGAQGTLFGSNVVTWNSTDSNGIPVAAGSYEVSVTATGSSRSNWTQISHDSSPGNYTFAARGLSVNNNSNSLYYGRVFIGNAAENPSGTNAGDQDTIIKLNADGSFAADGSNSNGGYGFVDLGDDGAPQKMRVAEDDRLYMMDLDQRQLAAFDMLVSTNEIVMTTADYNENPFWINGSIDNGLGWFSMDITDANTTNALIWLGQWDSGGAGIWNWNLSNGVAYTTNDIGNWVVDVGGSLGVAASGGLMVDTNFDIFVGQYLTDTGDTNSDCMEFTNWNRGLSYGGAPISNGVAWSVSSTNNTFLGVYDTTIDSRQHPNYVACALNGGTVAGGIRILDASSGQVVTNLDTTNQYYVTAWDNVGNLYAASDTSRLLRVFSPPVSTNQAMASTTVQVAPGTAGITVSGTTVTIYFAGSSSDLPSQITLQSTAALDAPFVTVAGAVATEISPGVFQFTTTVSGSAQFYRISDAGPQ
ncbi:MAG TPA: FlgD immunoglobulin-like domain containing protein [Verrucomicrobiae bacterium]|jgi:hypothetical protein|nr:FlgD immunoglobulin-like domain containing protein [Verrucomicrobiae bacterium]